MSDSPTSPSPTSPEAATSAAATPPAVIVPPPPVASALPKPLPRPVGLSPAPKAISLAAKPGAAPRPALKLATPSLAKPVSTLNRKAGEEFESPMPEPEDNDATPVWQPVIAGLAAAASLACAFLLFQKL